MKQHLITLLNALTLGKPEYPIPYYQAEGQTAAAYLTERPNK